jgi:hypothetical protein
MNSEHYAITSAFSKMKETEKYNFQSLTNQFFEFQNQNGLSVISEHSTDTIVLSQIFQSYDLFLTFKRLTVKTTTTTKSGLNPILKGLLQTKEDKETFERFVKTVVLFNLIKKQLKNKTPQEIQNYNLLEKLSALNANTVSQLNLHEIQNLTTKEEIKDFVDTYEYQNIQSLSLMDEDEYKTIHNLFSLFV